MGEDGVLKVVDANQVKAKGKQPITSTQTVEKKLDSTYKARLVARGFQQVEGQHYNNVAISSLVTSNKANQMVLTIMLVAKYEARVSFVKGAFVKGEFENNKEIYITVPKGFKKYYPNANTWLHIMKPIYGLRQAGFQYYMKAKRVMQTNGFKQCDADPCLFFKWRPDGIVMWLTWVDDNLVIAPHSIVEEEKDMMKQHFKCDDIGDLREYIR